MVAERQDLVTSVDHGAGTKALDDQRAQSFEPGKIARTDGRAQLDLDGGNGAVRAFQRLIMVTNSPRSGEFANRGLRQMDQALVCVARRSETLVVVSHA